MISKILLLCRTTGNKGLKTTSGKSFETTRCLALTRKA
jgi:hypothetical protein